MLIQLASIISPLGSSTVTGIFIEKLGNQRPDWTIFLDTDSLVVAFKVLGKSVLIKISDIIGKMCQVS